MNNFSKNYFLKNYLIFLYLVATIKWVEKLSLDLSYLALREIEFFPYLPLREIKLFSLFSF